MSIEQVERNIKLTKHYQRQTDKAMVFLWVTVVIKALLVAAWMLGLVGQ